MSDHSNNGDMSINFAVICPMANEERTAVRFVDAVLAQCMSPRFKSVTFFAVLDHASEDNTLQLLQEHAKRQPMLRVVWAPENKNIVDAYVKGYRVALDAGSDWILEIDAGFSHQPEDIPQFFAKMREGYDCVFGSRFSAGGKLSEGTLQRTIISRGGTILANSLLGTKLNDMTSGFEMFSRRGLETALDRGIRSHGPFFQTEIKAYCRHLKIAEVPIHYRAPSHNINRNALKDSFVNLWRLCRLRMLGQL